MHSVIFNFFPNYLNHSFVHVLMSFTTDSARQPPLAMCIYLHSCGVQSSGHKTAGCPGSAQCSRFLQVHTSYVHLPLPDESLIGIMTSNGLPSSPPLSKLMRSTGQLSSLSWSCRWPLTFAMLGTMAMLQCQAPSGHLADVPSPTLSVTVLDTDKEPPIDRPSALIPRSPPTVQVVPTECVSVTLIAETDQLLSTNAGTGYVLSPPGTDSPICQGVPATSTVLSTKGQNKIGS